MARATWLLGAISVASVSLSLWLYSENRWLRDELATRPVAAPASPRPVVAAAGTPERPTPLSRVSAPVAPPAVTPPPALPETPSETRMERRARRTDEFAAQF